MLIKMYTSFFSFVSVCLLSVTSGQSIDELIAASSTDVQDFEFFSDIEGKTVRLEYDMMLLKEQHDALIADDGGKRKKRKAIKDTRYRWPDSTIPYKIAPRVFSSQDLKKIQQAMEEWMSLTCIKFREATSRDENFIYINNGGGCYSYVGKVGGSQEVGLAPGCRHKGIIVHELGHAVGFHHEQNRPDRDQHVRIMFQNIPQNVRYNFKKYSSRAIDTHDVPYDYSSVMHYGGKAFSNNNGYTIKTINTNHQSTIGNRKGLSYHDVMLANRMYKCDKRCSGKAACPRDSFRGKDCKCYCKGHYPVATECSGSTRYTTTRPQPTRKTTPPPTKCKDANSGCPRWAQSEKNYCSTNTYVKTYCKKSCKLCDSGPTTDCVDIKSSTSCAGWKAMGFCTKNYVNYMRDNCQKTCDKCDDVSEGYSEGTTVGGSNVETTTAGFGAASKGAANSYTLHIFMISLIMITNIFY